MFTEGYLDQTRVRGSYLCSSPEVIIVLGVMASKKYIFPPLYELLPGGLFFPSNAPGGGRASTEAAVSSPIACRQCNVPLPFLSDRPTHVIFAPSNSSRFFIWAR